MSGIKLNGTTYTDSDSDGIIDLGTITGGISSVSWSDIADRPTALSQFTNDKGFTSNAGTITGIKMNGASKGTSGVVDLGTVITSHQDISHLLSSSTAASTYQKILSASNKLSTSYISGLASVATSGKYSDLSGTPSSLPASDVYSWAKASSKPSYAWSEITSKPSFAAVATSGSYTDLSNKPTIPTNTNQLTNGAGYITSSSLSGYATQSWVEGKGYAVASGLGSLAYKSSLAASDLPIATTSNYGAVKPSAVRTSAITAITGGTSNARHYGVEMDSNGKLFVNVPWEGGGSGDAGMPMPHYIDVLEINNTATQVKNGSIITFTDASFRPTLNFTAITPSFPEFPCVIYIIKLNSGIITIPVYGTSGIMVIANTTGQAVTSTYSLVNFYSLMLVWNPLREIWIGYVISL